MSMFRSPGDDASSDTTRSEASLNDEIVLSRDDKDKEGAPGPQSSKTLSLAKQQSLMIASLMRSHYQNRATDLLNSAHGIKYDQDSSEAIKCAQQMFEHASQLFVSKGLIEKDVLQPDFIPIMQQYLAGIDQLGVKALQNGSAGRGAPRLAIDLGTALTDDESLFQFDNVALALPKAGLQLNRKIQPQVSRYNSEFTEEEVLGRGGFGIVYHCINHIDAGHYAVKRINLDVRRLAHDGEAAMQRELQKILREIRTMAKMEHNNIVRYFGAWIEQVGPSSTVSTDDTTERKSTERSLVLRKTGTIQTESSDSEAGGPDGITFGEDSKSQPTPSVKGTEEDPITSSTSAESLSNETDLFTDGDEVNIRAASREPSIGMVLNVQMSLHEHNLATYLVPSDRGGRHCFHLRPALCIFLGILTGVQYIHASGFVHRDLKPANILMSDSVILRHGFEDARCNACPDSIVPRYLNVRVGDFGLAAEDLATESPVGTELYRPPPARNADQEDAFRIDEKLDVFALGILLFELLWPFYTRSERAIVLNNLRKGGHLPADFADKIDRANGNDFGVGGAVEKCIRGMVESDAGNRWDCRKVRRGVEYAFRMS